MRTERQPFAVWRNRRNRNPTRLFVVKTCLGIGQVPESDLTLWLCPIRNRDGRDKLIVRRKDRGSPTGRNHGSNSPIGRVVLLWPHGIDKFDGFNLRRPRRRRFFTPRTTAHCQKYQTEKIAHTIRNGHDRRLFIRALIADVLSLIMSRVDQDFQYLKGPQEQKAGRLPGNLPALSTFNRQSESYFFLTSKPLPKAASENARSTCASPLASAALALQLPQQKPTLVPPISTLASGFSFSPDSGHFT